MPNRKFSGELRAELKIGDKIKIFNCKFINEALLKKQSSKTALVDPIPR